MADPALTRLVPQLVSVGTLAELRAAVAARPWMTDDEIRAELVENAKAVLAEHEAELARKGPLGANQDGCVED